MISGAELRMVLKDRRAIVVYNADAELTSLKDNTKAFEVEFSIPPDSAPESTIR